MKKNLFDVMVTVRTDKTSVKPYKIHLKLSIYDESFKKRIENVFKHEETTVLLEENKGFLEQFLKQPIFKVKLVTYSKYLMRYRWHPENYLFPIKLTDDLLDSDFKGISFKVKSDAEFVKDRVEKIITQFLQEEAAVYLSI